MVGGIYNSAKAPTMAGNDYSYNNPVACFGVHQPTKTDVQQSQRINEGRKANTLVSGNVNGVIVGTEPKDVLGCLSPDREEKRQSGQRFSEGEKFYALTAQDQHGILTDGYIRKLTPIECCRLQTLPDHYVDGISPTQQYRALGNSWTRDIIVYILGGLK